MPATASDPPSSPLLRRASLLLLTVVAVAAGAWGWQQWQARAQAQRELADTTLRLDALEQRLAHLRRDQRAQQLRLQRADATNRVLRDELLGLGQRAALVEDSVARLADADRDTGQALRLDEAELLLSLGLQRLQLAGDLDGTRRAYALAAGALDALADPAYLDLRQTLAQERAALDGLDATPRQAALVRLDALADALERAPRDPAAPESRPWWRRALAGLVDVRRSDRALADQPADRAAAHTALQLELTLARAAIERGDETGLRSALTRAGRWLARLWAPSPQRERHLRQLRAIAAQRLSPALPLLGTTLVQLRRTRVQ